MSPQIQNGVRPSTMAGAAQTPWDDAVWDPSGAGRSPQSQCSGDARADMALARADMPARNQLILKSFLALAYQEPGARSGVRPQPRLRRHGVGPPLGGPGEQLMVGAQSLLWQPTSLDPSQGGTRLGDRPDAAH